MTKSEIKDQEKVLPKDKGEPQKNELKENHIAPQKEESP